MFPLVIKYILLNWKSQKDFCHVFRCTVPERRCRVWMFLMKSLCLNSETLQLHPATDSGSTRPALSLASVSTRSSLQCSFWSFSNFCVSIKFPVQIFTHRHRHSSPRSIFTLLSESHYIRKLKIIKPSGICKQTFSQNQPYLLSILHRLLTNWRQGDFYLAYIHVLRFLKSVPSSSHWCNSVDMFG